MKFGRGTTCLEDCYCLTPKEVFHIHWKSQRYNTFSHLQPRGVKVVYHLENVENKEEGASISINDGEPYILPIEGHQVGLGINYFFVCHCGKGVLKMFLPPGGRRFSCRKCVDLPYKVQTLKANYSKLNRKLNKLRVIDKLANSRVNISTVMYGGKFTKKFTRYMKAAEKAGLTDIVDGALLFKEFMENEDF